MQCGKYLYSFLGGKKKGENNLGLSKDLKNRRVGSCNMSRFSTHWWGYSDF